MPRAERVTDPDAELHVAGACCLGWPFPGAIIMCLLDIGHDGPCGWERWNEVDVAMLADQVDPVRRIERRAAFHRGARTWAHDGG